MMQTAISVRTAVDTFDILSAVLKTQALPLPIAFKIQKTITQLMPIVADYKAVAWKRAEDLGEELEDEDGEMRRALGDNTDKFTDEIEEVLNEQTNVKYWLLPKEAFDHLTDEQQHLIKWCTT